MDFQVQSPQAQLAFVKWVKGRFPRLYKDALDQSGLNMQLGDFASSISSFFNGIKNTLTEIAPAYIQTKAEYELLKLNLDRARAGQMPVASLEAAQAAAAQQAQPQQAGQFPAWLIPVGIGIAALILLRR